MSVRFLDYYHRFLRDDLMVLTYNHARHINADHIRPKPLPPKVKRLPPFNKRQGPVIIRPEVDPEKYAIGFKPIPQLNKIVVHTFVEDAIGNKQVLFGAFQALQCITGKHPEPTFSTTNVAALNLRKGMPVGCKVELLGDDMYHFLEKMVEVVMPRLRDFNGLIGKGDDKGRISFALEEEALAFFPDIEPIFEKFSKLCQLRVSIDSTAQTGNELKALLSGLQIPFSKQVLKKKVKETQEDKQ